MADTKISNLAAVTDVQDTDEFVLARSGVTNKIDGSDLFGMRLIQQIVVSSPVATIDFTSIPQTYSHLRLVAQLAGDTAAVFVSGLMRFNADSGNNYIVQRSRAQGTTASAVENINTSSVLYEVFADSAGALFSPLTVDIPDYTNSTTYQSVVYSNGWAATVGAGDFVFQQGFGLWQAAAAVTRITLSLSAGNFKGPGLASLYGFA